MCGYARRRGGHLFFQYTEKGGAAVKLGGRDVVRVGRAQSVRVPARLPGHAHRRCVRAKGAVLNKLVVPEHPEPLGEGHAHQVKSVLAGNIPRAAHKAIAKDKRPLAHKGQASRARTRARARVRAHTRALGVCQGRRDVALNQHVKELLGRALAKDALKLPGQDLEPRRPDFHVAITASAKQRADGPLKLVVGLGAARGGQNKMQGHAVTLGLLGRKQRHP